MVRKKKAQEYEEKIKRALVVLGEVSEDSTTPRNIRRAAKDGMAALQTGEFTAAVRAANAISLLADKNYEGLLFGDISALTQVNRSLEIIGEVFKHQEWHPRLINGSDYPLPGVMPVFSIKRYVDAGYLNQPEAKLLSEIRHYNPLLFDFLLKRRLKIDGLSLSDIVFETGRIFTNTG